MSDSPIFLSLTSMISSGDMSQASISSSALDIREAHHVAVQAVWTGSSPVGTLSVQGSIDGSTYTEVQSASAVSGNSGSLLINLSNVAYSNLKLVYTKTSGTGTINAKVALKQ